MGREMASIGGEGRVLLRSWLMARNSQVVSVQVRQGWKCEQSKTRRQRIHRRKEIFSPVADMESIRVLAAVCASERLQAYQDDVATGLVKEHSEKTCGWNSRGYEEGNPQV